MPIKLLVSAGLIAFAAWAAICALYYVQQDRLLFIGARSVAPLTDPRIQPIEHVVEGLSLRGVRVAAQQEETVLLYFGGNAEPVTYNALPMSRLESITAYLIDYRGYGASEGRPSEAALRDDALAHFDWIRPQHPKRRLVLLGRSLGSALALHVATRRAVDGVILISPFTSIRDVAAHHFPWLPVRPLLRHPFDAVPDARRVEPPVLVLSAGNDAVIPPRFTEALLRELPEDTEAHVISNVGHNDLMATHDEWLIVQEFVQALGTPDARPSAPSHGPVSDELPGVEAPRAIDGNEALD